MKTINDVPLLLRREIEALMIAPFLRAFAEAFGEAETYAIAARVVSGLAAQAGAGMAQMVKENTLEQFVEQLLPIFQPAENVNVKEVNKKQVRMDIVRCEYVDMYRRLGLGDLGTLLSCGRDEHLFLGYNPSIKFTRTKTLMEGDDCCDFHLDIPEKQNKPIK